MLNIKLTHRSFTLPTRINDENKATVRPHLFFTAFPSSNSTNIQHHSPHPNPIAFPTFYYFSLIFYITNFHHFLFPNYHHHLHPSHLSFHITLPSVTPCPAERKTTRHSGYIPSTYLCYYSYPYIHRHTHLPAYITVFRHTFSIQTPLLTCSVDILH